MIKRSIPVVGLLAGFTALAMAQKEESIASFGAQSGANLEIGAMEPTEEAVPVGLAGEGPAEIARYLMASGAREASLSPGGNSIAFSWSITDEPQFWTVNQRWIQL